MSTWYRVNILNEINRLRSVVIILCDTQYTLAANQVEIVVAVNGASYEINKMNNRQEIFERNFARFVADNN